VELGETLQQAVVREMAEETGLAVEPLEVLTVFDRVDRDPESGEVTFHYVIVDFLCRHLAGEAKAGSDALEVCWVRPQDISGCGLTRKATEVLEEAFRRSDVRGLALEATQE
jgi:ADP-ribose pyrophosphatase YjhB (NUDIX family)